MFLTIGFIIGCVVGWYVNDKLEDIVTLMNKLPGFKKKK